MKAKYTKKQILESIKYWKNKLQESRLDLDDDLDMEIVHSTDHIDQNLNSFLSIFSGRKITLNDPYVELIANALYKCIDVNKLKDSISTLKRLGLSEYKKAISSLQSLVYFVKCMEEYDSKTSLEGFEDDVY